MPGRPGSVLYHRSGGFNESALGLAISGARVFVWDAMRLHEFDRRGRLVGHYDPPDGLLRLPALAVGKGGRVYMAAPTDPPCLLAFDPGQDQPTRVPLPKPSGHALRADHQGHVWIPLEGAWGAYEFDERGQLIAERPSSVRSGSWYVRLEAGREAYTLTLYDEHAAPTAALRLPKDTYPLPRTFQYYDGQAYVGVFGTEPEKLRSLTLYSISPDGLTPKIKLPARVLFGGSHRQLMPDGTKYYLRYVREHNHYEVVLERYSIEDLGLTGTSASD
jgi:hypothetical protein